MNKKDTGRKTIFPDGTLQRMQNILSQGSGHGMYLWALGVLDATLILSPKVHVHITDQIKYNEGYLLREKEIHEAELE